VNASGFASGLVGGLKNFGKTVAASTLGAANSAERALGGAYSELTGKPGWQGQNTFNAAARLGLVKDSPSSTQPMLTPADGFLKGIFAPNAYSDRLVPTMQIANTPAAQPSASSPTVPARVLTSPLSNAAPDVDRTARAFVPTSPTANAAPSAVSPSTGTAMQAQTAGTGSAFTVPPATLSAPASIGPSSPSSFGAAVPQEAMIRALASVPGRAAPSGYVEAPESLQFGARPRRKLPNAGQ
jgi:hypothetical protein